MAAALAEERIAPGEKLFDGKPVTPEILVPRLGEYLVERGQISQDDLFRALSYQAEQTKSGRQLLLGQTLIELKIVTPEIIDQVITIQILELQRALQKSNLELENRVKERTRKLEQAVQKLKELSALKNNFIANISHELRTPLTHLKGYLKLFETEDLGSLTEAQKQAVAVLVKSEERLERLIEDLIQFSMVSRGKLTLNPTDVDLVEIIHIAIYQARQKTRQLNVEVGTKIAPHLPRVRCDEEKIGWVIAQLVDNAIKFSSENGNILVEAHPENDKIFITVSDTGIGIPEERLNEIFEPFHQLDGSMSRKYGGTGLGLALCKRILAAHGTDIQVTSTVGRGTRVSFMLPVYNEDGGSQSNV